VCGKQKVATAQVYKVLHLIPRLDRLINAGTLSGVDRTMGFYTPTVNQPGLSLPLLIDGVEYPGVQVFGVGYDQYPGFDMAPYDSTPFDNLHMVQKVVQHLIRPYWIPSTKVHTQILTWEHDPPVSTLKAVNTLTYTQAMHQKN
jgi:hypothetical protein